MSKLKRSKNFLLLFCFKIDLSKIFILHLPIFKFGKMDKEKWAKNFLKIVSKLIKIV